MTVVVSVEQVARLSDLIRSGGVVAYPTEAVFGLGCDPQNEQAVANLLRLKARPSSHGFLLVCASVEQALPWIHPSRRPEILQGKYFGTELSHTTWIFPKAAAVPIWITGGHQGIAIRVTRYTPVVALCDAFGGAIVSTSANPHGKPPARDAETAELYFGDRIAGLLAHAVQGFSNPSTIRDAMTGSVVRQ